MELQEIQLKEAKHIAEEADRKYEEVSFSAPGKGFKIPLTLQTKVIWFLLCCDSLLCCTQRSPVNLSSLKATWSVQRSAPSWQKGRASSSARAANAPETCTFTYVLAIDALSTNTLSFRSLIVRAGSLHAVLWSEWSWLASTPSNREARRLDDELRAMEQSMKSLGSSAMQVPQAKRNPQFLPSFMPLSHCLALLYSSLSSLMLFHFGG